MRGLNTSNAPSSAPVGAEYAERTRLVYEDIPGCPSPPFFDPETKDDLKSFEPLGVALNFWSKAVLKAALQLTGVRSLRRDPARMETLFRTVNRRKNFFAPVMSATVAIADHPAPIDPLQRAAALLLAARAVHQDMVAGRFAPDQDRNRNLEMGQYANLFSTSVTYDGECLRLYKSTCTSQITVLAENVLYSVDFGTADGGWTALRLLNTFDEIVRLANASKVDSEASPALMSGAQNRTQAQIADELQNDPISAESLETLRHSFLTICLDLNRFPSSAAEAAAMAHIGNPQNRWYNSALQIVVFGNSKACLIFNFNAYLDGNVQTRTASEIWKKSISLDAQIADSSESPAPSIRELPLRVPPGLLDLARTDITAISDPQQCTFEIDGFGRQFFASRNLDAVPAFVVALQLAIFRVSGEIPRIKQLLSMSKYRYVDLIAATVTTPQMIDFLRAMQDPTSPPERLREQLDAAIASQVAICRTARRYLPVHRLPPLLADSVGGFRSLYIKGLMKIAAKLLQLMKSPAFGQDEVLISHPRIFEEIPLLGRPGIRLPYVKHFGLHYQIWDSRIVLTWMPGVEWKFSNAQVTEELARALDDVTRIGAH